MTLGQLSERQEVPCICFLSISVVFTALEYGTESIYSAIANVGSIPKRTIYKRGLLHSKPHVII